ncbi:MAG: S-methyl-5-thioribose-1-phosphate isomerase [Chloroflexi bacterium]|nr:S-methyl-5-thioribose-1-phosphate isomerase [Chloroflexota bacterium]
MSDAARPAYEPVAWLDRRVRLLDQTRLPAEERYIECREVEQVAEAISSMRVRGAPAIGIAAAYGVALATRAAETGSAVAAAERAAARLAAARPTAVNLGWAVARVGSAVRAATGDAAARDAALAEATRIHEEQRAADRAIAEAGAALLPEGARLLTHCNTGPLATGGLGTALGVAIAGHRAGRVAIVWVDETRPRLQGARLTAWELGRHDVPYAVIADDAAATLMARGEVDAVVVGADRIATNGDVANKIGTYPLAIVAAHHGVPFYVAAPLSTIDPMTPDGARIPIEERAESEVLAVDGRPVAPAGARARNPAFDVTPAALVTAIVTEAGVLRAPLAASIAGAARGPVA